MSTSLFTLTSILYNHNHAGMPDKFTEAPMPF